MIAFCKDSLLTLSRPNWHPNQGLWRPKLKAIFKLWCDHYLMFHLKSISFKVYAQKLSKHKLFRLPNLKLPFHEYQASAFRRLDLQSTKASISLEASITKLIVYHNRLKLKTFWIFLNLWHPESSKFFEFSKLVIFYYSNSWLQVCWNYTN